jgi:hypothetical protein
MASRRGSAAYQAAEVLLKGPEIPLPDGHFSFDNDGYKRHDERIRWWDAAAISYRSAAADGNEARLPDLPLTRDYFYKDEKPVFFGHYWLQGLPTLSSPYAAAWTSVWRRAAIFALTVGRAKESSRRTTSCSKPQARLGPLVVLGVRFPLKMRTS